MLSGHDIRRVVAWGCSFTWGEGLEQAQTQASPQSWPSLVAEQLDCPVLNLSQCGASNLWITDQLLDHQFQPHDLVLIMWTWDQRTTRDLGTPAAQHISAHARQHLFTQWIQLYSRSDLHRQDRILRLAAESFLRERGNAYVTRDVLEPASSWADLALALDHSHPGPAWHVRIADQIMHELATQSRVL